MFGCRRCSARISSPRRAAQCLHTIKISKCTLSKDHGLALSRIGRLGSVTLASDHFLGYLLRYEYMYLERSLTSFNAAPYAAHPMKEKI